MWPYLVPFTSVTVLFLRRSLLNGLSNYLAFDNSPQFATWFYKMLFQALHFWNHLSVTHDSEMDGQMTYVIRTINISFLTQLLHTVQLDSLSKSLWDINSVSNILYYSHCHLCFLSFLSITWTPKGYLMELRNLSLLRETPKHTAGQPGSSTKDNIWEEMTPASPPHMCIFSSHARNERPITSGLLG